MRIDLNLSAEPFRNRSLFWIGIVAALFVTLTAGALVLRRAGQVGADAETLSKESAELDRQIADLQSRIEGIKREKGNAVLSADDRIAYRDAETLITQKSLLWTQLLTDLE